MAKIRRVGYALLFAFIALFCGQCLNNRFFQKGHYTTLGGHVVVRALSGSMEPTIKRGALVILKESAYQLQIGDIIAFYPRCDDTVIWIHRIIEIDNSQDKVVFRTKGDANRLSDKNLITPEQIIGKYIDQYQTMNCLLTFITTKEAIIMLIIVPSLILFISNGWQIYQFLLTRKEQENENK